jgi:tRNA threonylcarbamoyladenosine biosynthesis protein TsaE
VTGPDVPAAADGRAGAVPDGQLPAFAREIAVPTAVQMSSLGARLAGLLAAGDLVVLSGPLGAGKTTLAQGIGAGLRVRGPVTSPTFVIARLHPSLVGGPDLVHADAYRLGSRAEVDDLDLDADLATSVTVVEWGDGLVEGLADSFLAVRIDAGAASACDAGGVSVCDAGAESGCDTGAGEDQARTVRVTGWGARWKDGAAAAGQALGA